MQTEWVKSRGKDIDRQMYDFKWTNNLLKLIRTVELNRTSMATFFTLESGISAINFMPFTPEEKANRYNDQEIRRRT